MLTTPRCVVPFLPLASYLSPSPSFIAKRDVRTFIPRPVLAIPYIPGPRLDTTDMKKKEISICNNKNLLQKNRKIALVPFFTR